MAESDRMGSGRPAEHSNQLEAAPSGALFRPEPRSLARKVVAVAAVVAVVVVAAARPFGATPKKWKLPLAAR